MSLFSYVILKGQLTLCVQLPLPFFRIKIHVLLCPLTMRWCTSHDKTSSWIISPTPILNIDLIATLQYAHMLMLLIWLFVSLTLYLMSTNDLYIKQVVNFIDFSCELKRFLTLNFYREAKFLLGLLEVWINFELILFYLIFILRIM